MAYGGPFNRRTCTLSPPEASAPRVAARKVHNRGRMGDKESEKPDLAPFWIRTESSQPAAQNSGVITRLLAGVRRATARFEEFNRTRECGAFICEKFVGTLAVGELRIRRDAEPAVESPLDDDVVAGKPSVEKPSARPGLGSVELKLRGREPGTKCVLDPLDGIRLLPCRAHSHAPFPSAPGFEKRTRLPVSSIESPSFERFSDGRRPHYSAGARFCSPTVREARHTATRSVRVFTKSSSRTRPRQLSRRSFLTVSLSIHSRRALLMSVW